MKFALPLANRVRVISFGIVLSIGTCSTAGATTRTVTNSTDHNIPGQLSLREAIADSVADDTIDFKLPNGTTIPLVSELVVDVPRLIIKGPGADRLTIGRDDETNPSARIFNFQDRSIVIMSGLTIAEGNINLRIDGDNSGGGILNSGRLTLVACTVTGNRDSIAGGGGISNLGNLTLTGCALWGNAATQAGKLNNVGGAISNSGTLTITNCTISGNVVEGSGGGLYNTGTTTIASATFAANQANPISGTVGGGGIANDTAASRTASVSMLNTIVSNNRSTGSGPDYLRAFISQGYNLIGNTTDTVITGNTVGNQLDISPQLLALQNNGGTTPTHALRLSSPAIDKGNSGGLTTDQRGFPRPQDSPQVPNALRGDGADIGAYEAPPLPPIEIVSITRLSSAHILLICKGVPNFAHHIEASPDLIASFASIGTVVADSNGDFQFEDPNAGLFEQRFYRLTFP